jgi:hypothetical protein
VHDHFEWLDVITTVKNLYEISEVLKHKRFTDGAWLHKPKVAFMFDENEASCDITFPVYQPRLLKLDRPVRPGTGPTSGPSRPQNRSAHEPVKNRHRTSKNAVCRFILIQILFLRKKTPN